VLKVAILAEAVEMVGELLRRLGGVHELSLIRLSQLPRIGGVGGLVQPAPEEGVADDGEAVELLHIRAVGVPPEHPGLRRLNLGRVVGKKYLWVLVDLVVSVFHADE
jgi:hypothetical protein